MLKNYKNHKKNQKNLCKFLLSMFCVITAECGNWINFENGGFEEVSSINSPIKEDAKWDVDADKGQIEISEDVVKVDRPSLKNGNG